MHTHINILPLRLYNYEYNSHAAEYYMNIIILGCIIVINKLSVSYYARRPHSDNGS